MSKVKFRRVAKRDMNDLLQRRLTWFDMDSPETPAEELIKMDGAIRMAEEKMVRGDGDKKALRAYQMREQAMSDWTSGLNHA
jgi:hypothetical protein